MLTLSVLPETFAVCRMENNTPIPHWATAGSFFSITRTLDELSVVCPDQSVPKEIRSSDGWKCLKVNGPIDFSAMGVVQSLVQPLAAANISVFVTSTFGTDYVMVKEKDVESALNVLSEAGHNVQQ